VPPADRFLAIRAGDFRRQGRRPSLKSRNSGLEMMPLFRVARPEDIGKSKNSVSTPEPSKLWRCGLT